MFARTFLVISLSLAVPVGLDAQKPRPTHFVYRGMVQCTASPTSKLLFVSVASANVVNIGFLIELSPETTFNSDFNEPGEAEYLLGGYLKLGLNNSQRQIVFVENTQTAETTPEALRVVGIMRMRFDPPKDHGAIAANLLARHKTLPRPQNH